MAVADTETEYLASLRNACIARTGVSRFAHAALCDCSKRPTYCAICHRDDFECPDETLRFSARDRRFFCLDCVDELGGLGSLV